MKAAMYYSNSDVRTEEVPIPEIQAGELLVKVMASGICGSDTMEWYRIKKAPVVLGHEIAGVVEQTGGGVSGFKRGDRVVVTHHVPCETCAYCEDGSETVCETLRTTKFFPGGFAEYVRVPGINVEKGTLLLPREVSFDEGTFIEPLGCVVRGQRRIGVKKGRTVVVLGAGVSGLLHIQLAKARGVKTVIAADINGHHLKAAIRLGADIALNALDDVPRKIREHNSGRLADFVIVCTGAREAIEQALKSVDRGGTVLFFAPSEPGIRVPICVDELWMNEIALTTSYGAVKRDLIEAMELIQNGEINVRDMITHRLPLSEAGRAFRVFTEAEDSIKVILRPQE